MSKRSGTGVTTSPPDIEEQEPGSDPTPLEEFASEVADAIGGEVVAAIQTAKISVSSDTWLESVRNARDQFGLVYFSFLSAIDWANEVAVGDELSEPVDERFEVLCVLTELIGGKRVVLSTDLSKDNPSVSSVTSVFPGADWHEREAAEMFNIDFVGHPNLINLYLPDGFAGHPLQKSYPLLSREVKPWPGSVDVEAMPEAEADGGPSTENPEA